MIQDTYRYSSIDVARLIIAYANEHHYGINLTKMLKMLFFAYGTALALTNERLTDEHPVAWTYGPVFKRARQAFMYSDLLDISMGDVSQEMKVDKWLMGLMAYTFKNCGQHTATALVEWTHKSGSPWDITMRQCKGEEGGVIQDSIIRDYFKRVIYG